MFFLMCRGTFKNFSQRKAMILEIDRGINLYTKSFVYGLIPRHQRLKLLNVFAIFLRFSKPPIHKFWQRSVRYLVWIV